MRMNMNMDVKMGEKKRTFDVMESESVPVSTSTSSYHDPWFLYQQNRTAMKMITNDVKLTEDDRPSLNGGWVKNLGHFAVRNPHVQTGLHFVKSSSFGLIEKFFVNVVSNGKIGVLSGPPGLGKTTNIAYQFTEASLSRFLEDEPGIELLWISIPDKEYFKTIGKVQHKRESFKDKNYPSVADNTWLIVYDGVKSKNRENMKVFSDIFSHIRDCIGSNYPPVQIVITSEQSVNVLYDLDVFTSEVLSLNPWTIEDYYLAIKNDHFFEEVKDNLIPPEGLPEKDTHLTDEIEWRKSLIDAKYPIAGNCARFMFDLNYEDVKRMIESKVKQISDFTELYNSGPVVVLR